MLGSCLCKWISFWVYTHRANVTCGFVYSMRSATDRSFTRSGMVAYWQANCYICVKAFLYHKVGDNNSGKEGAYG